MPSHVAASPSSAMIAAPSVFSDMVTSLCQRIGRGRAWRCRRRSTLCSCAVRALPTGARIGDGAAVPVAAVAGRAPSFKIAPLPQKRSYRRASKPFGEKRRAVLTAQDRRSPHGHATRSPRRASLPNRRHVAAFAASLDAEERSACSSIAETPIPASVTS